MTGRLPSIGASLTPVGLCPSHCFVHTAERYVYAASLSRKTDRPQNKLEALLVSVGETLNETLYPR